MTVKKDPLNNYSHRDDASPSIQKLSDLQLEPTPAQRERLVYLVDEALDTVEEVLHDGTPENRMRAAENVLDRAGLSRTQKNINQNTPTLEFSPEVLSGMIHGIARIFNKESALKNVTPSHEVPNTKLAKPVQPGSETPTIQPSLDNTPDLSEDEPNSSKSSKSSIPASILKQYGDVDA